MKYEFIVKTKLDRIRQVQAPDLTVGVSKSAWQIAAKCCVSLLRDLLFSTKHVSLSAVGYLLFFFLDWLYAWLPLAPPATHPRLWKGCRPVWLKTLVKIIDHLFYACTSPDAVYLTQVGYSFRCPCGSWAAPACWAGRVWPPWTSLWWPHWVATLYACAAHQSGF